MAKKETLGGYLNRNIKEKGSSLAAEKAKGKKYKSISAAKKAGALYYTNKSGQVMAAVYAEDLKVRPKAKPGGSAVSPRAGVGGGVFAGKGAGKDKPKAKARAGNQDKGDSYDALMKKKRDAKKKADAQKRPDSGVFKSLDKDFAAQRKASQTPKARADNRDPSDLQYDIYLGKDGRGLAPSKPVKRPRSKTRFPEGNVSSSRSGAKQGMIRAGDEENALDALAVNRAREKRMNMNKGGMTKGYNKGGLRMVKKGDEEVPFFAADGKGKMNKGGMTKKSGYMGGGMTKKKVMTYNMGGMVKSQTNNLKKGRS